MKEGRPFKPTGRRLENLLNLIKHKYPQDKWVLEPILPIFLSIIDSNSTIEQQEKVITSLNRVFNDYEFRYNTILENNIMKDEFRRMQELAGVPVTSPKTDLNENFVGMGAINNPFANREKTDYELAFERYSNTLNEEKPSSDLSKKEKSAVVKKARAGKDIGGKGKGFEKVAKTAAKEYGSKEAGKRVAAAAMWKNIKEEEGENPVDTIMMDVPLFIRMLEYAREDASTDMDLHDVAEKAVTLSAQGEPLNMDSYNDLINQEAVNENVVSENSYSAEGYSIFNSEYDDSIGIAHDSAGDTMVALSLDPNVDFGETAVDSGTIKLGNKLVYWAVTTG